MAIHAYARLPGSKLAWGLARNLIFTWRRDPRYKPAADADAAPSFLPVEVAPEPSPPASAASDGRIEIALSNGHRVSAFGSFDADALCLVVRVLGG